MMTKELIMPSITRLLLSVAAALSVSSASLAQESRTSAQIDHLSPAAIAARSAEPGLLLAATRGDPQAKFLLGHSAYHGLTKEVDYIEALDWFLQAAQSNHPDAMSYLGRIYWGGNGVLADHEEAIEWYERAAEVGSVDAYAFLGEVNLNGEGGLYIDKQQARYWLTKAVKAFHPQSAVYLGFMFLDGDAGLPKSEEEAFALFEFAANEGHPYGAYLTGSMLYNGVGRERDLESSRRYFSQSCEAGYQRACGVPQLNNESSALQNIGRSFSLD